MNKADLHKAYVYFESLKMFETFGFRLWIKICCITI